MIESSTVLNSEKDFLKFDQIDRSFLNILGGPTELGWASMSQNLSLAKNPIIDRIEADPIHWQMKNIPFSHSEKPRKEEESLRQELGKQARRRG